MKKAMKHKRLLTGLLILGSMLSPPIVMADTLDLEALASADYRSEKTRARNIYRHPVKTLNFFGVRADMTVVEIWPGATGWYTEILAPFLN